MTANRPAWCPDPRCEFRGAQDHIVCGGHSGNGARLCHRFTKPLGVWTLDKITDQEITELQRLLARLYSDAKRETPFPSTGESEIDVADGGWGGTP